VTVPQQGSLNYDHVVFLTEAEKAAQKAEEEKAKELAPIKANKDRDLPPIKVPSSKQGPISNGTSDLNSPTSSSDFDGSSDSSDRSDNSGDKVDASHSSDLVNLGDQKSHADHSNSSDHKHMNGSAFEKTEFHNKMNKLEERHKFSTTKTVQIPGGSEVKTVKTVELRKITTNGTQQQATFKDNHEE
jgi:hypothetical protein